MSNNEQTKTTELDKIEAALPERALDEMRGGAMFPSSPKLAVHPDLVHPDLVHPDLVHRIEGGLLPAV
jgi:hypothetical protein